MAFRQWGATSRLAAYAAFVFAGLFASAARSQELATPALLSIGGAPPALVAAGQSYSFSPAAVVSSGGLPHFEIENGPYWATFSSFSGGLNGVPTAADAGTYSDIRISVTDGITSVTLPAFAITVCVPPGSPTEQPAPPPQSISLSWTPPTENSDGTPLTDLTGYLIYAGRSAVELQPFVTVEDPTLTRYVVDGIDPSQLFFAMTSFTSMGEQSALSEVVERKTGLIPSPIDHTCSS